MALRVENGGFVSQRQKGPASCVIPLTPPYRDHAVVAGSPEGVQWDGMVKLLPARKWMVAGSKEEEGEEEGEEEEGCLCCWPVSHRG